GALAVPLWFVTARLRSPIEPALEVGDLPFRLVLRVPVALLQHATQLLALTGDLLHVVVGELAPLLADTALELLPLAFDPILIHPISFRRPFASALAGRRRRCFRCEKAINAPRCRSRRRHSSSGLSAPCVCKPFSTAVRIAAAQDVCGLCRRVKLSASGRY